MNKSLLLSAATAVMALSAQAETYLSESFDYAVGNLYGNGRWAKYGKKTSSPLQVVDAPLSFVFSPIANFW